MGVMFTNHTYAQNIETMLNVCGDVLNERNEALYDEVENYLMNIEKDSLTELSLDLLYHTDLANLYMIKYNDVQKSLTELEYIYEKIAPNKHLDEYKGNYKQVLSVLGMFYYNSGNIGKAENFINKYIVEYSYEEFDPGLLRAYSFLSSIYENKGNLLLAQSCHDKCQEMIVKSYIQQHPEHSYYLDNFKVFKQTIAKYEKSNTISEEYLNTLSALGSLLYKINKIEYNEPTIIFYKVLNIARENNLSKCRCLEECYVYLQNIIAQHFNEPSKSQSLELLVPQMIDYFTGALSEADVYMSVSSALGANQSDELALVYDNKALQSLDQNEQGKLPKIYQRMILHYLGLRTDSANLSALDYLYKLKKIIEEGDEYYDFCLDYEASILRYVYRFDESMACLKNNLKYYKKAYGKISDQYIGNLNQLALSEIDNPEKALPYLEEAKGLISTNTNKSTVDAIHINLARCYLAVGQYTDAYSAILVSEEIEANLYGQTKQLTKDIKNQCLARLNK